MSHPYHLVNYNTNFHPLEYLKSQLYYRYKFCLSSDFSLYHENYSHIPNYMVLSPKNHDLNFHWHEKLKFKKYHNYKFDSFHHQIWSFFSWESWQQVLP